MATTNQGSRELCSNCGTKLYEFACICGKKLDFSCLTDHMAQISRDFQNCHGQIGEKLRSMNSSSEDSRTIINNWRQNRHRDIDNIAEEALNAAGPQGITSIDMSSYQETHNQLSAALPQAGHDDLNKLMELSNQIQKRIEDIQNIRISDCNNATLDAALQAKLQSSSTNRNLSSFTENRTNEVEFRLNRMESRESVQSRSSLPTPEIVMDTPVTTANPIVPTEEKSSKPIEPTISYTNHVQEPAVTKTDPATASTSSTTSNNTDREVENTYDTPHSDEFDTGKTSHIQRTNAIVIPTTPEKYAGTICCHDNQLLYNAFDKTSQSSRLVFIADVTNPTAKESIDWNSPDRPIDESDDEWIQDIVYSDELSGYLVLNRSRLRLYKVDSNTLDEFHVFPSRTMKRVSCCKKSIYLTSIHGSAAVNGDEILIMNSDKEEQACKTLRDILPARMNRGAGALSGEISDITVANNEYVAIGYRLERRHEVGICVFNLTNNGKDWSYAKQLVLNDCWHNDLSYTPRIDWCEKLQVFILLEYMTGHLIMIDHAGEVEGECRFMQIQNRRDSPINLTVSKDWLGVRYDTSIVIHKITS